MLAGAGGSLKTAFTPSFKTSYGEGIQVLLNTPFFQNFPDTDSCVQYPKHFLCFFGVYAVSMILPLWARRNSLLTSYWAGTPTFPLMTLWGHNTYSAILPPATYF